MPEDTKKSEPEESGRPQVNVPSKTGLGDIEDTRFALNDIRASIMKNTRIIAQLIKSNDARGIELVQWFKDRIDVMRTVESILNEHLGKMGGR